MTNKKENVYLQCQTMKIINIMKSNSLKTNNLRSKYVNQNWIIRLDGITDLFGEVIEIHSAVGYEKANNIGGNKFQNIIDKASKKGKDITKLKINHKLTLTLYSR